MAGRSIATRRAAGARRRWRRAPSIRSTAPTRSRAASVSIDLGVGRDRGAARCAFRSAALAGGDGAGGRRDGDPRRLRRRARGRAEDRRHPAQRAALRCARPLSKVLLWAADPTRAGARRAVRGDSGAPLFAADGETVVAVVAWTRAARRPKLRRHHPGAAAGAAARLDRYGSRRLVVLSDVFGMWHFGNGRRQSGAKRHEFCHI